MEVICKDLPPGPSLSIGLDVTAKLAPRVPPPILWAQNPCFLEVTRRVALQNIENKEVPCKIFQDKKLRAVSASSGSFRLKGGAKRTCPDDVCRKTSEDHCATKWGNYLQPPAVGPEARLSLAWGSWCPALADWLIQRRRIRVFVEPHCIQAHR